MKKILFFLVTASLLAACASNKTITPAVKATDAFTDPKNILSSRAVYFEFDSYVVGDKYKPVVQAHAKYVVGNRAARVVIQGNTDARGSREYNLALGQRRADSVKKMMSLLGAKYNQVDTVSFGEEKPKAIVGHESAYPENRRADIVYYAR